MHIIIVVAILAVFIAKSECQNCRSGEIASYDATETSVVCIRKITCDFNSECPSGQFCCPYQKVCLVQRAESRGYASGSAPIVPRYIAPSNPPQPAQPPQQPSYNTGYESYQPQPSYYQPQPNYYQPQPSYYQPQLGYYQQQQQPSYYQPQSNYYQPQQSPYQAQQQSYYQPQQPSYNGYRY